jgi:vacuolar-type H+-ATPase subunit F/Vma7
MGRLAVIGAPTSVLGFGLAGVLVQEADDVAAVRRAWAALPDDVEVVVLTPEAARVLADEPSERPGPLRVVMPA